MGAERAIGMVTMSDKSAKSGTKPSLSDDDIATYTRRPGPQGGAPGTDADADAHAGPDVDVDAPTDVDTDTAKGASSDKATDKDTS